MIHTEYELILKSDKGTPWEDKYKRDLVKDIISKMPISELEKFVKFEEEPTSRNYDFKLTATIELIDV